MEDSLIALLGFFSLFILLAIRMPVGIALMLVGTAGIWFIRERAAIPKLGGEIFNEASNYPLTIIPLFVLMGNLAGASGMSRDLYAAAHSWVGHMKGGLAAGSIAAGGTLGILIPPSAGFVIYAILTEESIGRLFMAGVLPGLMLTALFILAIWITVLRHPDRAPGGTDKAPLATRLRMLARAGWIIGIILLTIGGIYSGVFSAIEAAGIGATLAFVVTIIRGKLTRANLVEVFASTLKSSGTVFLILFGAFVFKSFIGFSGVTNDLADWVQAQGYTGMQVVIAFIAIFVILGMFMDGFAILVLTVPLVQPIIEPLGIDMVWFGVLMVIALEMGLISPPVGVNVFVVKGIAPNVPLNTIFRGIWPFWFAMLAAVILILIFPQIALLLPDTMFG